MLSIAERRKYILDSLNRHGFVRVADMAAEMNVTKATVRKDMEFLESRNLLYRTHGSASAARRIPCARFSSFRIRKPGISCYSRQPPQIGDFLP